ncbi:peptide ligase PGM1-related protein [Actinokineospora guangxiensis]|uniref:Peptide ligase PGM1-related protein n=1 Tax=Actinokineospora guangxiensis TaxID=1490288 RepID=A0ABW0EX27_9PSEU
MSTLIIGNSFNDYLVGDLGRFDPLERRIGGNISLRLAWLAEPGDVVVLPQEPDRAFVDYMMGLKGVPADSVTIAVPPAGSFGTDVITSDRLTDDAFRRHLSGLVSTNGVDQVVPYVFDSTIATLCRDWGLAETCPAFPFLAGGGADMLNSKSVFRALSLGVGAPVPEGLVTDSPSRAAAFVGALLADGGSVIVKQDFHQGGHGNEILTSDAATTQIGAISMITLGSDDLGGVEALLRRRWPAYSNDGTAKVVLERYLPNSVPIGAEVEIGERAITVRHTGEMRMTPIFDGVVLPGLEMTTAQCDLFRSAVLALCVAVQAIGYRGLINIDGIIDGGGRVLLTEYNGRLGGTTHLHWLGVSLVGPDYAERAVFVSNNDWKVPSFGAAMDVLESSGLAYDRDKRSGVVITCDHTALSGAVEYCVIGNDHADAHAVEKELKGLL